MSKQPHAKFIEALDFLFSGKDNRVTKFQKIKVMQAYAKRLDDDLKKDILEANNGKGDKRFEIAEETTRETAPNKQQFVAIFGQEMFDEHKNISTVKRHVKGIK